MNSEVRILILEDNPADAELARFPTDSVEKKRKSNQVNRRKADV